jgi:hypothetical protein
MPLAEPAGVDRPRHPERTVVYRLFEEHFERYVREYEDRYEAREGSLRKVVPTTVEAYLACGRLEGGGLLCAACGSEMKIVSVITEHNVIDAILRHLARTGRRDPFEGRAPPAA